MACSNYCVVTHSQSNMGNIFNTLLVYPITNVLVAIYLGLAAIHIPYALGFAIILLTIVIRLILYPFTHSQLKASHKMQKVTPHLNRLKEKHKGDNARIQQETMKLYKEHGINPLSGCLPVLLQLPIIWGLYTVLHKIVTLEPKAIVSEVNKIVYSDSFRLSHAWDTHFFGVSLAHTPSDLMKTVGPIVLIVPILTGVFQFIQSKMMVVVHPAEKKEEKKGKKEEQKKDDFAAAFQTQSLYLFPAMIGFFSFTFPVGLSLYWNTFTIFGILQQYRISGWGGLSDWIEKISKKK